MLPLICTNKVVDFEEYQGVPAWVIVCLLVALGISLLVLYVVENRAEKGGADPLDTALLKGETGVALEALSPRGRVQVYGEIWHAEAQGGAIEKGAQVVVIGIKEGLVIEVKRKE